jgi:hypothetical protein
MVRNVVLQYLPVASTIGEGQECAAHEVAQQTGNQQREHENDCADKYTAEVEFVVHGLS